METILALGSNLGDRMAALRAAVGALAPYVTVTGLSPVYETPAAYVTDQPPFLNMVLVGETKLEPLVLLKALKNLEYELGRKPTFHYGPRLIDLDILACGDEVLSSSELNLPHPRMAEREFVLRPLVDIAPNWVHPVTQLTAAQMLARLPETTAVCMGSLET